MSYSLGVDLGSTFVAAAVAHGARGEMVTLGDRTVVTPAVVYVHEDGSIITGEAAARRAVIGAARVGREFKRRLGDPTPVVLGGSAYPVTSLLAALLRDVMRRVTQTEGSAPETVVLTHPANWGPYRREVFDEVPQLAGLTQVQVRMVTEPEAAAAYYAGARHLLEGDTVAVYDLGGGTFDVTLLRKRAVGIDILGDPQGIERLGGVDFDDAILSFINYRSGGALSELDMSNPQTAIALARLRQDCVLAKEALSVDTETTIPVFLPHRHFDVRLMRAEFEDMIRPQVESTIVALTRTLRCARVEPSELSAVLLVGGSSRIPLVARMISDALDRPTLVDAHPKYAVALGAATLAAELSPDAAAGVAVNGTTPSSRTAAARGGVAHGAFPADGTRPAAALGTLVRDETRPGAVLPGPGDRAATKPVSGDGTPAGAAYAGLVLNRAFGPPSNGTPPPAAGAGTGGGDAALPAPPLTVAPHRRPRWFIAAAAVLLILVGTSVYVATEGPNTPMTEAMQTDIPRVTQSLPEPEPTIAGSVPIPSVDREIPVTRTPGSVAVAPSGKFVYVANRGAGVVTVVDTAINKAVAEIRVPDGPPQYLAVAPDGRRLYVTVFGDRKEGVNEVAVLDTMSNRVVKTIPVGTRPLALAVKPDGSEIYVTNSGSSTVSVIDARTEQVVTDIRVKPNPHGVEFSNDGTHAYTANHESNLVTIIDTSSRTIVAEIPVRISPHSVAVHPTEPLLANVNYSSNCITVIDTKSNKVIASVRVGAHPQDLGWAPDGRHLYVTNVDGDSMTVISADDYRVTATIATGDAPTSIAVLPDGRRAYVSNLNTGTLTVLDISV